MEKTKIADKKFFLDAFNNILDYGDNKVTILFDTKGDIWFGLKDMLKILGYTDAKHGIDDIKLNQKFKKKFVNLKVAGFIPPPNFQKNTFFINESGLYELLTKSNKPMAKQFLNKYLTEIMPQIRKTGRKTILKCIIQYTLIVCFSITFFNIYIINIKKRKVVKLY